MQFQFKPISAARRPEALERAERYRLLNEPSLAESICLDVLDVKPENQRAVVTLLLALTDQFGHGAAAGKVRELVPRLKGDYEQRYYAGIIWERSAHAQLRKGPPATTTRSSAGTHLRGRINRESKSVTIPEPDIIETSR